MQKRKDKINRKNIILFWSLPQLLLLSSWMPAWSWCRIIHPLIWKTVHSRHFQRWHSQRWYPESLNPNSRPILLISFLFETNGSRLNPQFHAWWENWIQRHFSCKGRLSDPEFPYAIWWAICLPPGRLQRDCQAYRRNRYHLKCYDRPTAVNIYSKNSLSEL